MVDGWVVGRGGALWLAYRVLAPLPACADPLVGWHGAGAAAGELVVATTDLALVGQQLPADRRVDRERLGWGGDHGRSARHTLGRTQGLLGVVLPTPTAWIIAVVTLFNGCLAWSARSELFTVAQWSMSNVDAVTKRLAEAREQQLELAQSRGSVRRTRS
ncbi:MAG: hypothetical protein R2867_21580 [Caldilineaceae bacterium]